MRFLLLGIAVVEELVVLGDGHDLAVGDGLVGDGVGHAGDAGLVGIVLVDLE